jgi:trk system potassium uptake protein TrkH
MAEERATGRDLHGARACRLILHPALSLVVAACLIALVGWTGKVTALQHWATTAAGIIFAFERVWLYRALRPQGREYRRLAWHAALGVVVFVVAVGLLLRPLAGAGEWSLGGHVFIQIAVIISGLASLIHHQRRFTARAFHPGRVLMGSFLLIIIGGALLLKMPRCVVEGLTLSWLDAFFTSTSAVCVTGHTVHNTALFFSDTGQVVILLLIQVGGLGIMTLTFFAAVVLFEGLSLHDRLLLGKMIQENRLARIGRTLGFIVAMTFTCEVVGAIVLYASGEGTGDRRMFHAVFHSVSAFCNAGFSSLPDGLANESVNGNQMWQVMIMLLVIIGGIGSLAAEDISTWAVTKVKRRFGVEVVNPRLRVHTRLVLVITAVLIVGGAGVFLLTEFVASSGPENGGKVLTAFFHSVTARTAGFNTVPMGQISSLTIQVLMVLMLVGGSPGGTAGGLRTTVVGVGLAHLWSQLRSGRRGMVVFNRTIPAETGRRALGLILLAGIWLAANFVVLQIFQANTGVNETTLLFELVSAFATVGLSLDLTPHLTEGAKAVLIVNMFVGRIGLLTVMATLIKPDSRPVSGKPTEEVLLT